MTQTLPAATSLSSGRRGSDARLSRVARRTRGQLSRAGRERRHAERSCRGAGRDPRQSRSPVLRCAVHRPGDPADRCRPLRLFLPHAARPVRHHGDLGGHPRGGALSGLRGPAQVARRPRRTGRHPDHAARPRDHRGPARGRHHQRRRNHRRSGRRLREPDGDRAAPAREGEGMARDRREGLCRLEPRLGQPRSRGEAVRPAAAAGRRDGRRQDRRDRLRHARLRRLGADRRLPLRPRPAPGQRHQDLRPPDRGGARRGFRRSGRSDDPQHLARGDRRRSAPGVAHRVSSCRCSASRGPA